MPPSAPVMLCRYLYDPLDRLAGSVPMAQAPVRCFYRKNRLATQIQGAVQRKIFHSDHSPLAEQHRLDTCVGTTLLATDRQRSVLQCVDPASTQALVYDAYGYQAPHCGLGSLLGFNGEQCDPLTGHYLLGNGYRAFNPVLMHFNSPDSLSPFGAGGLNAYAYCQGDPINLNDPDGHMKRSWRRTSMPSSPGTSDPALSHILDDALDLMETRRAPSPLPTIESLLNSGGAQVSFDMGNTLAEFNRYQGGAAPAAVAGPSSAMPRAVMQAGSSSSVSVNVGTHSLASGASSVGQRLPADTLTGYRRSLKRVYGEILAGRTTVSTAGIGKRRARTLEGILDSEQPMLRHYNAIAVPRGAQEIADITNMVAIVRKHYNELSASYYSKFGYYP